MRIQHGAIRLHVVALYKKAVMCLFTSRHSLPPGTLAHELLHAVDDILKSAGVSDTNGETDAYLLGCMFEHFFSVLEKDKKESLQNH